MAYKEKKFGTVEEGSWERSLRNGLQHGPQAKAALTEANGAACGLATKGNPRMWLWVKTNGTILG